MWNQFLLFCFAIIICLGFLKYFNKLNKKSMYIMNACYHSGKRWSVIYVKRMCGFTDTIVKKDLPNFEVDIVTDEVSELGMTKKKRPLMAPPSLNIIVC